MSSLGKKEKLFRDLRFVLETIARLEKADADIYLLALKRGEIKSSDVTEAYPDIPGNIAIPHLKKLASKGFLEVCPRETKSQPHATLYRVVNPRIALKKALSKISALPKLLSLYDEHYEFLSKNPIFSSSVWLSKSERVGTTLSASILAAAKQSISIYSHDCSWFQKIELRESLEKASSKGVTTTIIAHDLGEKLAAQLTSMGISLYTCQQPYGPPFCIVDNAWLLLPTQSGTMREQFSILRTNDTYLLSHFSDLFGTALSCSSRWRHNV
jgi:sugar-specific transcriptional regulator TrmB